MATQLCCMAGRLCRRLFALLGKIQRPFLRHQRCHQTEMLTTPTSPQA
jgi:hypothetical protein